MNSSTKPFAHMEIHNSSSEEKVNKKGVFSALRASFIRKRSDSNKSAKSANIDGEKVPTEYRPIMPTNMQIVDNMDSLQLFDLQEIQQPKTPDIFKLEEIEILKLVGKGGFAKVYKVRRKTDSHIFALKVMRKDHVRKMKQVSIIDKVSNVINEKQIQKLANDTQFVVKIFSTFQDPVHLFIVQEYLPGGDLFNYIKEFGCFSNDNARFYAAEIFLGLSFLHSLNIVYRDLKPENVLFGKDGHVRIADLGFAKKITEKTRTFCGTPSYLAPEVLNRQPYGMEVDWWTFGVLVFQLCSGCAPFQESHPTKTFARILNCAIRWPPKPQSYFTNEAFDLIMRLFELNPNERLKERDILAHEWFASVDFAMMKKRAIPAPVEVLAKIQMLSGEEYFPSENREQRVIVELSTGEYVESSERLFQGF